MILLIFNFIVTFSPVAEASSPAHQDWIQWKKQSFEKALTSPTSFLNAISLKQARAKQSLFLELGKNKSQTRWLKEEPKEFYAKVEHLGDRIRLQIQGKTMNYLRDVEGKRRKDFSLSNGLIAEVVYGKRNHKLWVYLYDPAQIKKFKGFQFYPFNEEAIVTGYFKNQEPRFVSYKTVQGDPTKVQQIGNVSFQIQGKKFYLPAYNWQKRKPYRYVALIFTDETRGTETYGGGRELLIDIKGELKDGQELMLDFNRTVNFYCAHSPFWHCPVGLQKHLPIRLNAGERLPDKSA